MSVQSFQYEPTVSNFVICILEDIIRCQSSTNSIDRNVSTAYRWWSIAVYCLYNLFLLIACLRDRQLQI